MLHLGTSHAGPVAVPLNRINRHALIAGATGTGKTTSVGGICEALAAASVPVLVMDAKGDLEGLARVGGRVIDCFGQRGVARPLDLTIVGPELVARALDLSEAQCGALYVAFTMSEAERRPLSSLADLGNLLRYMATNARDVSGRYGLVSPASVAAVQRALLRLERGASGAFGVVQGKRLCPFEAAATGGVTVLSAARLTHTPGLYGAVAAFLLTELFERAPEVGDPEKPGLVVVVDEAHLLFDGAPVAIVRRLEQVVRLIRSKGIGLIFATQSPADLPAGVAGQLQTRIQHGLRAVTPLQAKGVRAAADTMPAAPGFDAYGAIQGLRIGEALVSVPDARGRATLCSVVRMRRGRADLRPM